MRPKPMPAGANWQDWPTFESLLRDNPQHTQASLRARLRPLPSFKAEDNTTRYRPEDVEAALDEPIDDDDDTSDGEPSASAERAFEKAIATLPAPVLLLVIRDQRRAYNDSVAAMRAATATLGDTIKAMAEPLKQGIALQKDAAERSATELQSYRDMHDRMVTTTEALLSEHAARERQRDNAAQSAQMRSEGWALLKERGLEILNKWSLTAEGTAAIGVLRGLDLNVLSKARLHGFISDDQWAAMRKVRPDLPDEPTPDPEDIIEPPQQAPAPEGTEAA